MLAILWYIDVIYIFPCVCNLRKHCSKLIQWTVTLYRGVYSIVYFARWKSMGVSTSNVITVSGLLSICSNCHVWRGGHGLYWWYPWFICVVEANWMKSVCKAVYARLWVAKVLLPIPNISCYTYCIPVLTLNTLPTWHFNYFIIIYYYFYVNGSCHGDCLDWKW